MDKKDGNKIITTILMVIVLFAVTASAVLMIRYFQGQKTDDDPIPEATSYLSEEETYPENGGVILCYGDSNTYGFNPEGGRYDEEERWTTILGEMLGDKWTVINEGLNGRTTDSSPNGEDWRNGLETLPEVLREHMPVDIIVFMLGTNDTLTDPMKTPEEIALGMEALLIKTAEIAGEEQGEMPAVIIVVPAAIKDVSGTYLNINQLSVEVSEKLPGPYKELAEKYGCGFVDASKAAEVSDWDHVHLTREGHRQLAELLYREITE